MPNPNLLLQHSLLYGLILSALMSALFLGGAMLNPEVMLRGYPPDIKAKYGPASEASQKIRKPLALLLFLFLFGTVTLSLVQLTRVNGVEFNFWTAFLSTLITFFTFNLVDLVILDWLIFVTLQPKFVVLVGTEGMAGYKDYVFHFKAFLRGTVLCLAASFVIAGIALGIYALAS